MHIGKRLIGEGHPVFIVAEISGNHNQSLARAKKLLEAACKTGVDAVKLQTYTPDTLTIDSKNKWFWVGNKNNKDWQGMTLHQLYQTAYTPWEWYEPLKKIADQHGVILFSTPFDETAVDFLEKLNVPVYKIASYEMGDLELLKKVAKTKKPVIISKAFATKEDTALAVKTLRSNGAKSIALLHCVDAYPSKPEAMNLSTISDIGKRFNVIPGLSDHSLGITTALTSVALGAKVIEKHITLKRADGGPDAAFSLEPHEFKELVRVVRDAEKAIGKVFYGIEKSEQANVIFKRSLFVVQDVKKGEKFTRKNVRCIRPGYGLAPKYLSKVLGKKATRTIARGTPLKTDMVS